MSILSLNVMFATMLSQVILSEASHVRSLRVPIQSLLVFCFLFEFLRVKENLEKMFLPVILDIQVTPVTLIALLSCSWSSFRFQMYFSHHNVSLVHNSETHYYFNIILKFSFVKTGQEGRLLYCLESTTLSELSSGLN